MDLIFGLALWVDGIEEYLTGDMVAEVQVKVLIGQRLFIPFGFCGSMIPMVSDETCNLSVVSAVPCQASASINAPFLTV